MIVLDISPFYVNFKIIDKIYVLFYFVGNAEAVRTFKQKNGTVFRDVTQDELHQD